LSFAVVRVRVLFSTYIYDEEEEEVDEGDDGDDSDSEDQDGDEYDDDNEDSIECIVSFSKPQMGVMLIVAQATENAFSIKSVSYSRDTNLATEHLGGKNWMRRVPHSTQVWDLTPSLRQSLELYIEGHGLNSAFASLITQYATEKRNGGQEELIENIRLFMSN